MKSTNEIIPCGGLDQGLPELPEVSRRTLLKIGAGGAVVLVAADLTGLFGLKNAEAAADTLRHDPPYSDTSVKTIRTACMMCNAGCGLQVRVKGGQAIKIEGNPFCPHTHDWSAATRPTLTAGAYFADEHPGRICGRGNAGLKTLYDPYRVLRPLKRVGPRGSGQWEAISWKQAYDELINGAALAQPGGNGTYTFTGLKAIRDPSGVLAPGAVATAAMDSTDTAYPNEAPKASAANTADQNAALYGLKANRYVWLRGRDQIADFTKHFNESYGTKNHIEHSSICNTAWAGGMKYNFTKPSATKSSGGGTDYKYLRVDLDNVEYLVIMGSNPLEANVGTPFWARKLMDFKARGGKLVVIDPYFTHTASKADVWVPIKPGHDLAFLLGLVRYVIENNRHLSDYLARPNADAAQAGSTKYYNWTDMTFLVEIDSTTGKVKKYLDWKSEKGSYVTTVTAATAKGVTTIPVADTTNLPNKGAVKIGSEIIYYSGRSATSGAGNLTGCQRGGFNTSAVDIAANADVNVPFLCKTAGGSAAANFVNYGAVADTAELDYSGTTAGGKTVKTTFRLVKDAANARTLQEWADLAGVDLATLTSVANDLSAGTKKSCIEAYRGAWAHTNGFVVQATVHTLHALLGRIDKVGGYCTRSRYGPKAPTRAVSVSTSGARIDRVGSKYEGIPTTPTRQWYPLAGQASQEVVPSAGAAYPYKCLAFFHYCSNPTYTYTNSQAQRDALLRVDAADSTKYAIPLTVSATIFMDETAAIADYILPDSTYLERYTAPFTGYPTVHTKSGTIRRPVVGTYRDITIESRNARIYIPATSALNGTVFATVDDLLSAWVGPMPYDEQLVQLGKKLQLPNFGANALKDATSNLKDLDTAYQFWDLSFAAGDFVGLGGEGGGATLTPGNSGAPGDSTQTTLQEGGKWSDPSVLEDTAKPGWVISDARYGDLVSLFAYKPADYENKLLHENYPAYAHWVEPGKTLKGNTQTRNLAEYPFTLLTHKRAWQTQSRSTSNEWLRELQPEGFVYVAAADASTLGLVTGDKVKLSNRAGRSTEGKVRVIQGIRPGCVMVDHHFGRRSFGSSPYFVNGNPTPYDRSIGVGPDRNLVQNGDDDFPDVGLTDPVSGQATFYWDTVKIQKT